MKKQDIFNTVLCAFMIKNLSYGRKASFIYFFLEVRIEPWTQWRSYRGARRYIIPGPQAQEALGT